MTHPQKALARAAIIVIDHGSRVPEANALLDQAVALYQRFSGAPIVEPAHMDLAEPTLEQAFARCAAQGATSIVVLPYFLAPGRHGAADIPRMAQKAAQRFPGVSYCVAEPLGLDVRLAELMHIRVLEALERSAQ